MQSHCNFRSVGLTLLLLGACSIGAPGPGIDVDRAITHARALVALGPHPGETPGSARALAYIEAQLAGAGTRPERLAVGTVELPAIEVLGRRIRAAHPVTRGDPNLVVRFGPAGPALLVIAHYDTVPTSPGALDNSTAVGVLVELARVLAASPPKTPVMLAFTANEEVGLVGAEALAAQRGAEVLLAISLDVIGGPGELSLNGASTLIGASELAWLAGGADRAGVVVRAPLAHRVVSRWWPQAERSDHGAFTRRGIRAFHFYGRGHDGDWIDLAYHTMRDDASRIDRDAVDGLGRLLRALTVEAPPVHDGDGVWVPVAVNTVVPRWPLVALEVVLAAIALVVLVRMRDPLARGGLGLLTGIACYAAATGAAYAIEHIFAGDHPAPWLHAPRAWTLGIALALGGALGLATRFAARFRPWIGAQRYLSVAIALPLVFGLALLFAGAAELAWIWLAPAALIALAPRLAHRAQILVTAPALLPAALVLDPRQLREAAWNGFLPPSIALTVWVAVFAIPVAASLAWYARVRRPAGPLGALLVPAACALALVVGLAILALREPACSGVRFDELHLACEAE